MDSAIRGYDLGDGSATYSSSHFTPCLALGDVDGDMDLDIFICDGQASGSFGSKLLINHASQGSPRIFIPDFGNVLSNIAGGTKAAIFADLDGDGDIDLMLGNSGPGNQWFRNGGDGSFVEVTTSGIVSTGALTRKMALVDIDTDGDLDLIVGNAANQPNELLLNGDGLGNFSCDGSRMP